MTVAGLIAELQRMPQHLPVRVLVRQTLQESFEDNALWVYRSENEAEPADEVAARGSFVLVSGAPQ